jgi:DNA-binding response OmpR family regulator
MRLLVVEDERRLAMALQKGLQAEGFEVDVALDGRLGLALATEHRYDAIMLDIMLPGLNGYRVCAALRAAGDTTPILMLTAKDGEYDEAEALDTGADDYLTKPFSYLVLVARIRALLRRSGAGGPDERGRIEVGDLTLVPAEHRCLRGDVEISLTPREFAVLEQLALRPGEVVTKSEIVGEVWDLAYAGDVNVVEVHVSALRRKLDTPFDRHSIETVRGVGYRLVADAP